MIVSDTVKAKTYTGAKMLLRILNNLGVDTVFGYPGSAVLSLYDEIAKQSEIKHYLMRHEQAAVHAAEGYARVSGKCGVVIVTSGPGAANTVSGIANAYMDGYPLLVITGQVEKNLIGTNAFQEIDIVDITKSCTKSGYRVTNIDTLQGTLTDAYRSAITGKKGPVVVDISKNVFDEIGELKPDWVYTEKKYNVSEYTFLYILDEIKKSKRPLIVSGGGVVHSRASAELQELVSLLNLPVVHTMMGIGTVLPENTNNAGMIGTFGDKFANDIVKQSDLILSLGARFNDKVTCCFKKEELSRKFIQVDINKNEISKIIPAAFPVVCDIKYFLQKLIAFIKKQDYKSNKCWTEGCCKYADNSNTNAGTKILSSDVIRKIYNLTKNYSPIITTEVGQHQISVVKNYKFTKPGKLVTSGGSGTMGFGLPAAIGASIAMNGEAVICIAGDGSFQMNEQELATIKEYNLPVKIFIMNNGYLGMVRQLQDSSCEGRYSNTKISNPDFVTLAGAYGIPASRVVEKNKITEELKKALSAKTPYLIDFVIEPYETM